MFAGAMINSTYDMLTNKDVSIGSQVKSSLLGAAAVGAGGAGYKFARNNKRVMGAYSGMKNRGESLLNKYMPLDS